MCHRVSGRKGQYQDTALNYVKGFMVGQPVFHSSGQLIFLKCVAAEFLRIGIIRHYRCGKHRDDRTAGAYVSRHAGSGESDPADILCRDDGVCRDKSVFGNLKRGGILLIQIAVGSLYMFSVPRGYIDGFTQWCKQVIGICLTAFLQSTMLTAGLMIFKDHPLLGLGVMLSSTEVPRIAGQFGLDTSTKANLMSGVYAAQTAINISKTVVKAVAA